MLFLVQGKVSHYRYMGSCKSETVLRLVSADDEHQASVKFEKHYSDKSIPNDDSWTACAIDVSAMIE
jgi:hypothetical protein